MVSFGVCEFDLWRGYYNLGLFLVRILLLRVILGADIKAFSCCIHIIRKYQSEINEKRDSNCKVNKKRISKYPRIYL